MLSALPLLALVVVGYGKEEISEIQGAGNIFRDPPVEYRAKFRYW